jgi:hypothetical protein
MNHGQRFASLAVVLSTFTLAQGAMGATIHEFARKDDGSLGNLRVVGVSPGDNRAGSGVGDVNGDFKWIGDPGTTISDPAPVSWGTNRLDVFYFADATHMDHAYSSDNGAHFGFDPWDPSGLVIGTSTVFQYLYKPAIASQRSGRLDVFATTNWAPGATTGTLIRRWWDNASDSHWMSWYWDKPAASAPAAVGWTIGGSPRVDVFFVNSSNHLYHTYTTSDLNAFGGEDDWGAYSGEVLVGDPAVASWGDSRLDVLVNTQSGRIAHWFWDHGSFGQNLWSGASFGPLLRGSPYGGPAIAAPAAKLLWTNFMEDVSPVPGNPVIPYAIADIWDNNSVFSTFTGGYGVLGIGVCASN